MITIRQFTKFEQAARRALKQRDGAAFDAINTNPEVIACNMLIIPRDSELYLYDRAIWLEEHGQPPCYAEEWK